MQATLFGTDGIRTRMGKPPFTPINLVQLGTALGYWITKEYKAKSVALAHDTRLSCPLVKAALKTGLLQHNITLTDAGVLPTPALFYNVTQESFDIGIMITASHNSYQDNGIKLFTKKTGKSTPAFEQRISELYHTLAFEPDYTSLGVEETSKELYTAYQKAVTRSFPANFLQDKTIILDCAHGAYYQLAPETLRSFGAHVITLSDKPTGKNINESCGSQHTQALKQAVITHKAAIGFAFDGDGDRVVLVTQDGKEKNGDDIIALLLTHSTYQTQTTVVGTIMTNQGLEAHLQKQNKKLIRTAVGDKNVIRGMQTEQCLLGGETSGHIIARDFTAISDGLFICLRALESIIENNNWAVTTFKKFPQYMVNVPIKQKKDLTQQPYAQLITEYEQTLTAGRVIVRYSGTEPVLRVMVEDPDSERAQEVGMRLSKQLAYNLNEEMS